MTTLQLKKAQRSKAYLKLGISAPSGGGKTLGSLLIAYGLMKEKYPKLPEAELWEKIAIIDTENGSGELYVGADVSTSNVKIGEYNAITINPPFTADKYINAINLCVENQIEVAIIDSSTHLWSGQGGLLEQQGNAAKRSGNSYTAWRDVTPLHNQFVDTMLQSPIHIIATMRSKQEYVQEKDEKGRTTVRKVGLEPEQRKGMEYEFTTFLEINSDHEAFGAKDRTSIFDAKTFKITPDVGKKIMKWLESGVESAPVVVASSHKADGKEAMTVIKNEIVQLCKDLGGSSNDELMTTLSKYAPNKNPNSIEDPKALASLKDELTAMKELLVETKN